MVRGIGTRYIEKKKTNVERIPNIDVVLGKYIKVNGTIGTSSTGFYSKPIMLRAGETIHYNIEGYSCSLLSSYNNGVYTPIKTGTGVFDAYYTAEEEIFIVFSGTPDTLYAEIVNPIDNEVLSINERLNNVITDFTDFEGAADEKIEALMSDRIIISSEGTSQRSKIFKVSKNDVISITINQYSDTCAIGFSDSYPTIGDSITVLSAGLNKFENIEAFAPSDGFVMITYRNNQSPIFADFHITQKRMNNRIDFEILRNRTQKIEDIINNGHIVDFRQLCKFVKIEGTAAGDIASFSGNDVIEKIYEPLRQEYPQYITRRSLGKDATGRYDIWLYEFSNSTEEWFDINKRETFFHTSDNKVLLPNTFDLTSKQCAIEKNLYDDYFSTRPHENVYFLMNFSVRKLLPPISIEDMSANGMNYYKFTFAENVKLTTTLSTNDSIELWWTTKVYTYDQHAMIVSGVHADEMVGYVGTALALKYMIEHHEDNVVLDYIFNHMKLSVIPIVNIWGANQSPKVRSAYDGSEMNDWSGTLNHEQSIIAGFMESIHDEISFYIDFHTSEHWQNYGFVYAIPPAHTRLYPSIVATANYLCKSWFPELPPYNWNIGASSFGRSSASYVNRVHNVESATIEFCGKDLQSYGNCSKWDAKYMTYVMENYVNFLISMSALRISNNSKRIIDNSFFGHLVMS